MKIVAKYVLGIAGLLLGGIGVVAQAQAQGGVPLSVRRYNAGDDLAKALAVDGAGNIFVTGSEATPGKEGCPTVAYSGTGAPLWNNRFGHTLDLNFGIAADARGNVFVAAQICLDSNCTATAYATIKYSSSVPPVHLDFQRLNNQLALSWTNVVVSLQSAPAVTETFTNIPGATSPYTNVMTGAQQFFRLATR